MKIKQLKKRFTLLTGMPATKVFVKCACGTVEKRSMRRTEDWEWAITNLKYRVTPIEVIDVENLKESIDKEFNCLVERFFRRLLKLFNPYNEASHEVIAAQINQIREQYESSKRSTSTTDDELSGEWELLDKAF